MLSWILGLGWCVVCVAEAGTGCLAPERASGTGRTALAILPAAELAEREVQRAAVERRAPRPTSAQGALVLEIERPTAEAADLSHHTLIALADDEVILRHPGAPGPATSTPGSVWHNTLVVPLPEATTFPLIVHAFDQAGGRQCGWVIDARGEISRM